MNRQNSKSREQLLQEVTELQRRVAELEASAELLGASEARMRAVLANNAIVVFDHDRELRYTHIYNPNPNFTVEGVVGKTDADLFLPADAAQLTEIKRRVLATGVRERQIVQTTLNGESFYYDLTVEPRLDEAGQVVGVTCAAMDITGRKRSEEALSESEERLRMVVENSRDGINLLDLRTGKYIFMSPSQVAMTGFTAEEMNNFPVEEAYARVHPDDRYISVVQQQQIVAGQTPPPTEYRWKVKSGEYRRFSDNRSLVRDLQGNPTALVGISRDITERKRIEAALGESERLELVLKGAELGMWDWYIPTGELVVNERWAEMLGYSLTEVEPHISTWEKLIHPVDAGRVLQNTEAHLNGQTPLFQEEYRVRTKSGEWKWILDTGKVIAWDEQGQPVRAAGVHQDITERKQTEAALRASEARFATIFQASPLSISIVRLKDHQFIDVNHTWETRTGFSREETIGRTPLELNLWVNPDERAQFLTQMSEYGSVHGLEAQFRLKSGVVVDVLISAESVDIAGEQCMLVITQNITERKRMEAALADERAFLARRVEERTAELSQANADLTRALRVKNEFMSTMTHELRTPLMGILGISEVMQEGVYGPLNERQLEQISLIEKSGQRLLALINDILDLTHLEAGKVALRPELVSVGDVCRVSVQSVTAAAHQKNLTLSCHLPDQPLYLQANPHRLQQILVNLLGNAVKFTPAGGQISLQVTSDPVAGMIHLAVQDSGIGIKPEQMGRLFQPFTQLDSSLARSYEGAGLGLVLVRRLVELHGGTVGVESEGVPGQGSRFTVSLPWRVPH